MKSTKTANAVNGLMTIAAIAGALSGWGIINANQSKTPLASDLPTAEVVAQVSATATTIPTLASPATSQATATEANVVQATAVQPTATTQPTATAQPATVAQPVAPAPVRRTRSSR